MSRSEFMEAICRIAVGKTTPDQFATVQANEDYVMQSITDILSGPMLTYWSSLNENLISCSSQYARELLQHSETYLKDIFENYGSVSREGPVIMESTLRDIIYGSGVAEERLVYNQILEDIFLRQCRVLLPPLNAYGRDDVSVNDGTSTPRRYVQ